MVGFTNNGRLVIVLQDSSYTGQYSKLVTSDDHDMSGEDLMGATGIEFHGNDRDNVITGSSGNDLIWLYGGDDQAAGGLGDDILVGGDGDDILADKAGGGDTDTLYGGPGSDYLDVADGDTNDVADRGAAAGIEEPAIFDTGNNTADNTASASDGPTP